MLMELILEAAIFLTVNAHLILLKSATSSLAMYDFVVWQILPFGLACPISKKSQKALVKIYYQALNIFQEANFIESLNLAVLCIAD